MITEQHMISQGQWAYIFLNSLGLRSEANASDITSAASYAMDDGAAVNGLKLPPIPSRWNEHLRGTIELIKSFPNAHNRFLLIVSKSSSTESNREYANCFPKCSVKPTTIHASTSLNASVEDLMDWVVQHIPGN